mmetsp:Transcript_42041/g.116082  ORF Transcript_42041/g.116082 Transcript_42041/m.116082 type:complete len:1038 (+) Transcript_42041:84-3197(+)
MVQSGAYRKERTHQTGKSNRTAEWKPAEQTGPINFDHDARSTAPQLMRHTADMQVPANAMTGQGNQDFAPKLAGSTFRLPASDRNLTLRIKAETKALATTAEQEKTTKQLATITAPTRIDGVLRTDTEAREARAKGHKVAPRWNPNKWFTAPQELQPPLQREEGETWNSKESQKVGGEIKGQDRLMRTVRRPEDVMTPQSEKEGQPSHPIDGDAEEYYPGRHLIDAVEDQPGNDFQTRPIHLPDFFNPPPEHGDRIVRMQRIREVVKQRYAGRPGLMSVFRNCALTKEGYVFPKDLQTVFDQMGIKVSDDECDMLIKAVDKDHKGAVSFEEFADLIFGQRISVGGAPHEAQERHVRHVTKNLVDSLITNGQKLGKAFCEIDPERRYLVSKEQFCNALGTACNHISNQAVEFLWAAQFQGQDGQNFDDRCIDWRGFMSQLAEFAHANRAPTPCCVQGRKRQYDLLQRTAPITGGDLANTGLDLNRPEQNAEDEVRIVADKLTHREANLAHKPRDAAFLTENYVEDLRVKASRADRSLYKQIPKARLRELLQKRESIHQDDLVDLLLEELARPGAQAPLPAQEPIYADLMPSKVGKADVMTLDSKPADSMAADVHAGSAASSSGGGPQSGGYKLAKADLEAFAAARHHNRDHEINVEELIEHVYKPEYDRKQMDIVNDGLNRQRRLLRPPRERPPHTEMERYENHWQALNVMDQVNDAISTLECSNGGRLKPSRVFKLLDMDGDGYVTMSDLKTALEKYKVDHSHADVHAMFSALDRHDSGSVDIGEFTRNYTISSGSVLDAMQRPIEAVYHEGGVHYGGPVQQLIDERDREIAEGRGPGNMPKANDRAASAPPNGAASDAGGSERSRRSQISRAGMSIAGSDVPMIYAPEVARLTGKGRVSDVIRARYSQWKPQKSELYTSMPKTRYGMTCYPDTRHVTEANVPLSSSYLHDNERFKTTNSVQSIFAVPDHRTPQIEDAVKKHARNEFRIERIRARQREFADRCSAANEACQQFDELKIARKALNQLNYERKCSMACA